MAFISSKLNAHSATHFVGCYALVFTLHLFFGLATSAWIAAGLGFLWEVLDESNYHFFWGLQFLDYRGADVIDLLVDWAGVGLAVLMITLV